MHKRMQSVWLIAPVTLLIGLSGCASGGTSLKIKVSKSFLDQLISEQETIDKCCPATASVVDDWIVQNGPK